MNQNPANLPTSEMPQSASNGQATTKPAGRFYRRVGMTLVLLSVVMVSLIGLGIYAINSTQTVPQFYQAALDVAPESHRVAGEEFESRLLQLNTDVRHQEEWKIVISQEQVNGWLAIDLPEKFPETLPSQISEPRIAFAEENVQLAFKFDSARFSGIVTASGDIFCTEFPNQIGLQIKSLRSGVLPLPIDLWADRISEGFATAGINLMWSQKDGDTLAVVDLPGRFMDIRQRKITIEEIKVEDGQIVLSGTSLPTDEDGSLSQADFYREFQELKRKVIERAPGQLGSTVPRVSSSNRNRQR